MRVLADTMSGFKMMVIGVEKEIVDLKDRSLLYFHVLWAEVSCLHLD